MLKKTNIPVKAIPIDLDENNVLTTNYKTNILYPTLGPSVASGYMWFFYFILRELARFYKALIPIIEAQQAGTIDPLFIAPQWSRFFDPAETIPYWERRRGINNLIDILPNQIEKDFVFELIRPNLVTRDLFHNVFLKTEGKIADFQDIKNENLVNQLLVLLSSSLKKQFPNYQKNEIFYSLAEPIAKMVEREIGVSLYQAFQDHQESKDAITAFLVITYNRASVGGIQKAEDDGINADREWAFQRYEQLQMTLGTPVFRGPVSATSVSPKSKFTITETDLSVSERLTSDNISMMTQTDITQTALQASQFSQSLNNLSEYGMSNANQFNKTETITSALSEDRRSIIESTARRISTQNQSVRISRGSLTSGITREYITKGKDLKRATTELGFDIVVPIKAQVRLQAFGLVWCPRILSPFIGLRKNIRDYERNSYQSYLDQYYVPEPIAPLPRAITEPVNVSVEFRWGEDDIGHFSHTLTDSYSYFNKDDIAIELNGIDILDFTDSRAKDQFDITIQNVRVIAGKTIKGEVVFDSVLDETLIRLMLGTIDRSVIVNVVIPVIKYTEAYVSEMILHEANKQESELKKTAIRSRAFQFARLRRNELIERYNNEIDLSKETFRALIRKTFIDSTQEHRSYYEEIISRCINWEEASLSFESRSMNSLFFKEFAPDHFMNTPAVRFFLPIISSAENVFFETLNTGGTTYYDNSVKKIRGHLEVYREFIDANAIDAPDALVLDEFDTEITIGRHLEAVMSNFEFSE